MRRRMSDCFINQFNTILLWIDAADVSVAEDSSLLRLADARTAVRTNSAINRVKLFFVLS